MSDKRTKAIEFATNAHKDQRRKTTGEPYIVHPMAVMNIVCQYTDDEDVVCAAVLHDTIEDTPTSAEDIEKNFGEKIKNMVVQESEPDKTWSWEQRKQHTINRVACCNDRGCLLIACADKLDNLNCCLRARDEIGDEVWTHFKRGFNEQKWYHTNLLRAFKKQMPECKMVADYEMVVNELFGKD